jgi:hypothetical protein
MKNMAMQPIKKSDLAAESNPLPEGTYHLRVHKATYVHVPKDPAAKPYIRTWLVVADPDEPHLGRMVFANYPVSGNGAYRLDELLTATGHDDDFVLVDPAHLVGLEFKALVMVQKSDDGWPDKNIIKRHMPLY